jgi:hypothetical protein
MRMWKTWFAQAPSAEGTVQWIEDHHLHTNAGSGCKRARAVIALALLHLQVTSFCTGAVNL